MSQKTSKPSAAKRLADEAVSRDGAESNPRQVNVLSRLLGREVTAHADAPPPPPTTSHHLPPPLTKLPAAPERDFARFANSIARDALPAGLFKGTSKKTYDVLYQRTRAAVRPTREIKAKQGEIREWARVSHNTLREHLRHLESVGLLQRKWELGDNDGVVYEVFIPEEIEVPPYHHLLPPPTTSSSDQKLVGPSNQKLVGGGRGQVSEESTTSAGPKTLIKTDLERTDDEAFAGMIELLQAAGREVTGKESPPADAARWKEVAELLVAELRVAAARTSVTSAPAFLAEHLRRRLSKPEQPARTATPLGAAPARPALEPATDEDLVEAYVNFLHSGMTPGELEQQFSGTVDAGRWPRLKTAALARYEAEKGSVRHLGEHTPPPQS